MSSSSSPELTAEMRAELARAAALPDHKINLADPDAPEALDWSGAVRGKFYRPRKEQLTLRLDADILAFYRAQAPEGGYQTAINRDLRETMLHRLHAQRPKTSNGRQGGKRTAGATS
jgi:uncharacterized protein (DUF4415 family)